MALRFSALPAYGAVWQSSAASLRTSVACAASECRAENPCQTSGMPSGTDESAGATVAASVEIDAPVDLVWGLVANPANYARWSSQVTGIRRLRGTGEWQVGDSWIGSNRVRLPWATHCVVSMCERPWNFGFTVDFGPLAVARWTYEVEPNGSGTRVTERWDDRRYGLSRVVRLAGPVVGRGWDAASHNLDSMRQTLAALKVEAEAESAAGGAAGSASPR